MDAHRPDDPATWDRGAAAALVDGVTVVNWPAEGDSRATVVDPAPRVLVESAPLAWDDLDEWVLRGGEPTRLAIAPRASGERAQGRSEGSGDRPQDGPPTLDDAGIVRGPGGRWVAVPPVEARLLAPLLARRGRVVRRPELRALGWPGATVSERAIDGRMKLLRRRLGPLGLRIHTVRGLGFLLEAHPPAP